MLADLFWLAGNAVIQDFAVAAGCLKLGGEDSQKSRLSRSILAEQSEQLTSLDSEIYATEGLDFALIGLSKLCCRYSVAQSRRL